MKLVYQYILIYNVQFYIRICELFIMKVGFMSTFLFLRQCVRGF